MACISPKVYPFWLAWRVMNWLHRMARRNQTAPDLVFPPPARWPAHPATHQPERQCADARDTVLPAQAAELAELRQVLQEQRAGR
jgi:hypothetical protein